MTEAQNNASGPVEVTEEVKRLAEVCLAEGKRAEEIEGISDEVRAQLGAYLRHLDGQKEKTLPPEQAEALLDTLKKRFERNLELHKDISWTDVEKALRAAPNLLWRLQQLEATGGEPDILADEGDAFRFGDFSKESPSGRRNVVFDAEAEAFLRENYPSEVCNGNAADRVAEWGVEFMSPDEYRLLQKLTRVDVQTRSLLRTFPSDIRRTRKAYDGGCYGIYVNVAGDFAHDHSTYKGFRCSLRVPKV